MQITLIQVYGLQFTANMDSLMFTFTQLLITHTWTQSHLILFLVGFWFLIHITSHERFLQIFQRVSDYSPKGKKTEE